MRLWMRTWGLWTTCDWLWTTGYDMWVTWSKLWVTAWGEGRPESKLHSATCTRRRR